MVADAEWFGEGHYDASAPITYGIVPTGMCGVVSARPLVEGEVYFVQCVRLQVGQQLLADRYLKIQDGKVVVVPEN